MFKFVIVPLLLGTILSLTFLSVHFAGRSPEQPQPALVLDPAAAQIEMGAATVSDESLSIELDARGMAVMLWPLPAVATGQYPFVHMDWQPPPSAASLSVFWKTPPTGDQLLHYQIPDGVRRGVWQSMQASQAWRDEIVEFGVVIQGTPGQTLAIESVELLSASVANQVAFTLDAWFSNSSWSHLSIDAYAGNRSPGSTFSIVPVMAAVFAVSLLTYGLMLLLLPQARFEWRMVAAQFLICWIGLDLVWQRNLLSQLEITQSQFQGKDASQKRTAGPDAALQAFAEQVKQLLPAANTRIFVSSSDDYLGMRGAYYLYPLNVYWERGGPELPALQYIHSGDHIFMLASTAVRFDRGNKVLITPAGDSIAVEAVTAGTVGGLFRVM